MGVSALWVSTLWVFRTATATERAKVPGWRIRSVVLGEQVEISEASLDLLPRLTDRDSLLVTSPRAASWLCRQALPKISRKPVFVAGPGTGRSLADAGWDIRVPETTGGEAALKLLASQGFAHPLYLCASETAGTVEATNQTLVLDLVALAVYATVARQHLDWTDGPDPDTAEHVAFLAPSAVHFLSASNPALFAALAARRPAAAAGIATREALESLGWRDIRTATGPDLPQLVQAFGDTHAFR